MAVINIVGFETGANFELRTNAVSGTASVQSTTKRTGGFALRCNPTTTATGFGRIAGYAATGEYTTFSVATLYARFYFRYATKPAANSEQILTVYGTAEKAHVRIDSDGKLSVWDNTTQVGSTGATVLAVDTWYRIDFRVGTGTNSAYELRIDGTTELSGTRTWANNQNNVEFQCGKSTNRNGQTVDFFYDDVCLSDSDFPPAGAVVLAKANGNGTYTAWTGDYTPEWDEAPPITTDDAAASQYVATSTNTNAESATMENFSTIGGSGTIQAVKTLAIVKQGASAVCKVRLRSNTTDNDTTGFAPGTSYVGLGKIYETDPATSSAWSSSGFDAIEVGVVHAQSQVRELRCTAVFAMVDFINTGDYSLNCEPGSYSLSGMAAGTVAGRMINAESGSYSISGVAATLSRGFQINAEPGSYSISGVSAGLIADRMINAQPGSYLVNGVAASIVADRMINAESGTYLITGTNASVVAGRVLAADPGAYAIVGVDAALVHVSVGNYSLNAEPGVYSITGFQAGVIANRMLNAESGGYSLTGAQAGVVADRMINAEPGVYTLTGPAATLEFVGTGVVIVGVPTGIPNVLADGTGRLMVTTSITGVAVPCGIPGVLADNSNGALLVTFSPVAPLHSCGIPNVLRDSNGAICVTTSPTGDLRPTGIPGVFADSTGAIYIERVSSTADVGTGIPNVYATATGRLRST